jgi:2-polyprenyl-3-methyl-5-hydroxy-6-metoxy-1,4-benzoquinol methylase
VRTRAECPLCEAPAAEAKHFVTTARGYDLYECPSCGLVYGREILDEEAIYAIYDDAYARKYEEPPRAGQNRGYADRFFSARPRGRALEVGCGTGRFLRRLGELGYDAYGVEVSPACAAYAADLRVVVAAFERLAAPPAAARFDYVISFHVLEHVASPLAFARRVAAFLRPEGIWFNYMPNVRAHGRRTQVPVWIHFNPTHRAEHVNFFDARTIRVLAKKAALEVYLVGAASDDFWCEARCAASVPSGVTTGTSAALPLCIAAGIKPAAPANLDGEAAAFRAAAYFPPTRT